MKRWWYFSKKYEKFQNTMSEKQGVILISELGQEFYLLTVLPLFTPWPDWQLLLSQCLGEWKMVLSFSLCTTPTKNISRKVIFPLLVSAGEDHTINVFCSPSHSQAFPQQEWRPANWSHFYKKSIRSFTTQKPWFHKMGQCWRKVSFLGIKIGNLLSGIPPASHIITSMTN